MFLLKSKLFVLLLLAFSFIPTTIALNATVWKSVLLIPSPPKEKPSDYLVELAKMIKSHEGGFAVSSVEPGGAVNKGVTYQAYVTLSSKLGYSASYTGFKNLSDSLYEEILWYYAYSIKADRIWDKRLRFFIVDFAWNSGSAGALFYVKQALIEHGVKVGNSYTWDESVIDGINQVDANKLFYSLLRKRLHIAKKSGIFAVGLELRYRSYEKICR